MQLVQTADDTAKPTHRILFVSNHIQLASLQLSFLKPLADSIERGVIVIDLLVEKDIGNSLRVDPTGARATKGIRKQLKRFRPTLIVFCRYSYSLADIIVEWARAHDVPTIFHIDDDLLNVPVELGQATTSLHDDPSRRDTVRYLLKEATLVYCSTSALLRRFFGNNPPARARAGRIYCAHPVRSGPKVNKPAIIGYMGTRTHTADLQIAIPAVAQLLDDRPDVSFEIFGEIPIPDQLARFGGRVRQVDRVVDYAEFMDRLVGLPWSIGICPLANTRFNSMKADTKWVEYTASGMAVVASAGLIYDECCSDGCGLLATDTNSWYTQLTCLLTDQAFHRSVVERAQAKLSRDYAPTQLHAQILSFFSAARSLEDARRSAASCANGELKAGQTEGRREEAP